MIKELLSKLIQQIDELAKPTKSNLFNSDKFPRKYQIGSDFMSTITIDKITRRVIRDKLSEEQRQKRILKAEQKRYDLDSISWDSRAYRD